METTRSRSLEEVFRSLTGAGAAHPGVTRIVDALR
jgi:hypothetical protein